MQHIEPVCMYICMSALGDGGGTKKVIVLGVLSPWGLKKSQGALMNDSRFQMNPGCPKYSRGSKNVPNKSWGPVIVLWVLNKSRGSQKVLGDQKVSAVPISYGVLNSYGGLKYLWESQKVATCSVWTVFNKSSVAYRWGRGGGVVCKVRTPILSNHGEGIYLFPVCTYMLFIYIKIAKIRLFKFR